MITKIDTDVPHIVKISIGMFLLIQVHTARMNVVHPSLVPYSLRWERSLTSVNIASSETPTLHMKNIWVFFLQKMLDWILQQSFIPIWIVLFIWELHSYPKHFQMVWNTISIKRNWVCSSTIDLRNVFFL